MIFFESMYKANTRSQLCIAYDSLKGSIYLLSVLSLSGSLFLPLCLPPSNFAIVCLLSSGQLAWLAFLYIIRLYSVVQTPVKEL